jgi:PAS domain S-box-containing protein
LDVIIVSYHGVWNSREKYRKVFDATSYIIIQTDPSGKIISANKVVSFLGFDVFDLIGQDLKDLCEDTLSDASRAHISTRRVHPRGKPIRIFH